MSGDQNKTTPADIDQTEPWGAGHAAFMCREMRIAPDDLTAADKIEWLAGYDAAWRKLYGKAPHG